VPTVHHSVRGAILIAAAALPFSLPAQTAERVDSAAVARLREEGTQRSQVMDIMSWLTDVHGPRLTGSPTTKAAAQWAMQTMRGWGLANVRTEAWGPFGRGWMNERFAMNVVSPVAYPVIAYSGAWSPGTNGPVTSDVVLAPIDSEADFAKFQGKLRGKLVMIARPMPVRAHFAAEGQRYTQAGLDSLASAPAQVAQAGGGARGGAGRFAEMRAFQQKRAQFLRDEGVAVVLQPGRGDGGNVFAAATGDRDPKAAPSLPTVIVSAEHYGRMARTLERGVPVKVELDVRNRFYDDDLGSFNVLAEIPGSDRAKKDEVVMIGAHFDSWHTGTGATDNAAGSAVMMEAMRILKASGVPMKRTVRIGLWTGEEQGLLGSRAWVKANLADRDSAGVKPMPAHAKFSSYFNVDNGTGQIRGVYQQGNAAVAPIFSAWMAPFKDWGVGTVTMRNTGGTDHLSFDAVGLPGFQFIQDPIEYGTRTHHSSQDVYERIEAEDMRRNAVIVATFAYLAANRDALVPRKQ
jgi:carboxypeptidase Q